MELPEFQALLPDFDKLKQKIMATKTNATTIVDYLKQYNPADHEIMDKGKRPDQIVTTDVETIIVVPARLSVPMQKKIVMIQAAILCGNPIELQATPADDLQTKLLSVIEKTWKSNKLDYESKRLVKLMMSETEVAELWYTELPDPLYWSNTPNEGRPMRLRMKIIANSYGDSLYPVFSNSGDMIAFGRGYHLTVEGKQEEHFDVYTDNTTYLGKKITGSWEVKPEDNMSGKIPVIYYSQPKPEWADVQTIIDRYELTLSGHSDTNDYFGSPMVIIEGEVEGFAKKGQNGKLLKLKDGAKASYLTWDQSPKSLELEFKNLRSLMFDMTDTPDITKDNENLSGVQSGIALQMRFLPAHLKAADREETFGKSIQRRINFIKAAMARINLNLDKATGLEVSPRFEYYLPKNESEMVDMLVSATGGGKAIMSTESAVKRNPLVDNVEEEMKLLEEEGAAAVTELP